MMAMHSPAGNCNAISVFVNVDMGQGSLKVIKSGTIRKLAYGWMV